MELDSQHTYMVSTDYSCQLVIELLTSKNGGPFWTTSMHEWPGDGPRLQKDVGSSNAGCNRYRYSTTHLQVAYTSC